MTQIDIINAETEDLIDKLDWLFIECGIVKINNYNREIAVIEERVAALDALVKAIERELKQRAAFPTN